MAGPVISVEGGGTKDTRIDGAHTDSHQADYLTKILFTKAHCLSHDVNRVTKSSTHIDLIMGFSTGEIIWWEPITQRYTRLNKNVWLSKPPDLRQD
jgi:hypothetical protein